MGKRRNSSDSGSSDGSSSDDSKMEKVSFVFALILSSESLA